MFDLNSELNDKLDYSVKKNEPIRVAHIIGKMCAGGVESVVYNYYREIDKTKFQFDFFYDSDSTVEPPQELIDMGAKFYEIPPYQKLPAYLKSLKKHFINNHYEIVHSHMNTLCVFSMWAAKKAGVSIRIAHNHSTLGKGETKKNILKFTLRPFAKVFPTQLCACSDYAGRWIYGKHANFVVFNNAIDLDKYTYNEVIRKELRRELSIEDKYVIGHIGRFCYAKNHEFIIDIFNEVCKKRTDVMLMLIGTGEYEEKIKHKVIKLGIENKVLFLGIKNDAYKYYQAMDLFLFPSKYEGLGMVSIEAQASGLPVICSTAVPREAKVTDLVSYLSLQDGIEKWVDAIVNKRVIRENRMKDLTKAGYNIKKEVNKLSEMYMRLIQDKHA